MTGANFVKVVNTTTSGGGVLNGTAVVPASTNFVKALNPTAAQAAVNNGPTQTGIAIDKVTVDLSLTAAPTVGTGLGTFGSFLGGYAKNGAVEIVLTGTTPVDVDLTDLTVGGTQKAAGDTTFSSVSCLVFKNQGAAVTIKPGGSNPADLPKLGGTSPTLGLKANAVHVISDPAGTTVDSTHKIVTITPTSGGSVLIAVGGA